MVSEIRLWIDDKIPTPADAERLLAQLEQFGHLAKINGREVHHYTLKFCEQKLKERGYEWGIG